MALGRIYVGQNNNGNLFILGIGSLGHIVGQSSNGTGLCYVQWSWEIFWVQCGSGIDIFRAE